MSINHPRTGKLYSKPFTFSTKRLLWGWYCYIVIILARSVAAASFYHAILCGFYSRAATNRERHLLNSALSVKSFIIVRALRKVSCIRLMKNTHTHTHTHTHLSLELEWVHSRLLRLLLKNMKWSLYSLLSALRQKRKVIVFPQITFSSLMQQPTEKPLKIPRLPNNTASQYNKTRRQLYCLRMAVIVWKSSTHAWLASSPGSNL